MASVGNAAAYGRDLLDLLAVQQRSSMNGSPSAPQSTFNQSLDIAETDSQTAHDNAASDQLTDFTATPVIFTTNPATGAAVQTTFQVYTGAPLPSVALTSEQLKALQEAPATSPRVAPTDLVGARQLLSSVDTNNDGKISRSELESAAVARGSNVEQADALFSALAPNGQGYIDESRILATLSS